MTSSAFLPFNELLLLKSSPRGQNCQLQPALLTVCPVSWTVLQRHLKRWGAMVDGCLRPTAAIKKGKPTSCRPRPRKLRVTVMRGCRERRFSHMPLVSSESRSCGLGDWQMESRIWQDLRISESTDARSQRAGRRLKNNLTINTRSHPAHRAGSMRQDYSIKHPIETRTGKPNAAASAGDNQMINANSMGQLGRGT